MERKLFKEVYENRKDEIVIQSDLVTTKEFFEHYVTVEPLMMVRFEEASRRSTMNNASLNVSRAFDLLKYKIDPPVLGEGEAVGSFIDVMDAITLAARQRDTVPAPLGDDAKGQKERWVELLSPFQIVFKDYYKYLMSDYPKAAPYYRNTVNELSDELWFGAIKLP